MEIYNEQIKDLLETTDASGEIKKLEVKSDPATGGTQVPDLHLASVSCIEVASPLNPQPSTSPIHVPSFG